jgi:hypothetical protein
MNSLLQLTRGPNIGHHLEQLIVLCYSVVTGMSLLIFVAAETDASEPLPSKSTSASAATPTFRQWLPSRCLAMDYAVTIHILEYEGFIRYEVLRAVIMTSSIV